MTPSAASQVTATALHAASQPAAPYAACEKIRNKMGNYPVGKKVNTPKVNTRVNTFLRTYLGSLFIF